MPMIMEQIPWSEPFYIGYSGRVSKKILVKSTIGITEADLNSGMKIIAMEKRDGANIARRDILVHKNVVRYVKQYNYRAWQLHNWECVDGRAFTRFLAHPAEMKVPDITITENDYKKITLGWNFLHYTRNQKFVKRVPDFNATRDIDVFFAGTTEYVKGDKRSGELISEHRKTCAEMIQNMKGLKTVVAFGRDLNANEYADTMYRSKVTVSPWGWGESCYRDYEGILAGCVVVKPLSDFMTSRPNIYDGDYLVYCNPNWKDLEEKIHEAIKLAENISLLEKKRNSLMEYTGEDYLKKLVGDLCEY